MLLGYIKQVAKGGVLFLSNYHGKKHTMKTVACSSSSEPLKADSHIACRAHAVPLPCRAAKRLECVFSYLIYKVRSCMIHTCHAVLLKATAQHGRRETACGLPARFRLLPATTRSSTKIVIRSIISSSQRSITTTVKSGSSALQKRRSVKLLD
jgi:hypothetical protein